MITLRHAVPEDEEGVFPLAREMATSYQVERAAFSQTYARTLGSPDMCLIVAKDSGNIIGYVLGTAHPTFYANGNVAWVEEIMVQSDFRKKGIGKLLMTDFEKWAALKECRLVALATRRAADFYLAIGYSASATYFRKVIAS